MNGLFAAFGRRAVLFVAVCVAFSAFAAPKKKRVEDRYTAPQESESYRVSVKAPGTVPSGAPVSAVITIEPLGDAKLSKAPIKVETSAGSSVKFTLVQSAQAPEEADVTLYFTIDKPGTHEILVGVPVKLEGANAPVMVAVPFSVTRDRSAPDAGS